MAIFKLKYRAKRGLEVLDGISGKIIELHKWNIFQHIMFECRYWVMAMDQNTANIGDKKTTNKDLMFSKTLDLWTFNSTDMG